jgi:hypothetical protein
MQYFLFTVTEQSWREHFQTGIAAINDPGHNLSNRQGNAKRQAAMCELVGIKKGDIFFFYFQQRKKIMGVYEAVSEPFFDKKELVKKGFIDKKFPIRVAFKQKINFPVDLEMDEIWEIKDKGYFWSIQQQRGDTVGRHACISLTKQDGERILKMFFEKNPVISKPVKIKNNKYSNKKLPFDCANHRNELHYEATLQGILLDGLKKGEYKQIFGEYDYFVPFFPTSSQREIDILLFRHGPNGVIWYEILELKQGAFEKRELDKLMNYEKWVSNSLALNSRMVHAIGIANKFNNEVKAYIKGRVSYGGKAIRLIKYSFDKKKSNITLKEENRI